MTELILGIDIGTTSLKAAVFNSQGENQASAVVEYALLTPDTDVVEAPCSIYMESIKKCMEIISATGKVETREIVTVGFSVQGETLCFLDGEGSPLRNAIVWMDNRAVKQAEELRAYFGDELCYKITGQVSFEACWPAAKVLWVKENEPEVYEKVKHILLLEDYIIYLLTGKFVSEGSLLCSTEYWDIKTKDYWKDMLAYLGMQREWLPDIKESGEIVGTILPEMAEMLKISKDAQIATGCLDQVAGAIGVGNIKPGLLSENIGAALAICAVTEKLTYDPNRLMPVHYFAVPDTYMMHTFTTGGMCLRWFRDNFCQEEMAVQETAGVDAYDLINKAVEKVSPGSEGLIALPHLQGSMAPDVNLSAKGVFYGATLLHKKAHFARSIMESLGYIIRRNLEAIQGMGIEVKQIRTMGGGSKSDIWNQIKSDITGKQLYTTQSAQDAACLGAAILAGKATGVFDSIESACESMIKIKKVYKPDEKNRVVYEEQYEKYKALFRAMEPIFQMDAKGN